MIKSAIPTTLAAALTLVSCGSSPVLHSIPAETKPEGYSTLGAYYLPEKSIIVSAKFDGDGQFIRPEAGDNIGFIEVTTPGKMMLIGNKAQNDYDEKIKIETENGYLTKISTDISDKRPDALATLITDISGISDVTKPPAAGVAATTNRRKDLVIRYLLDPLDPAEVAKFNRIYAQNGVCLRVVNAGTDVAVAVESGVTDGVLVPALAVRRLELQLLPDGDVDCTAARGNQLFAAMIEFPRKDAFVRIDIERTAWVQHKVEVVFDKGVFKSMDVHRGSATAAVTRLPVLIAKAIVSIPAEIVQLRINQSSMSKRELDAMKASIDSEVELLKAQAALEAARKKETDRDAPTE